MTICDPAVRTVAQVPEHILKILNDELALWDFRNDSYKFSDVFLRHKRKDVHVKDLTKDSVPDFSFKKMEPVISWCESLFEENHKTVRAFFNLLEPGQEFPRHADSLKIHSIAKRLHISLTGNNDCYYYTYKFVNNEWIENVYKMNPGILYEISNVEPHSVKNVGSIPRVNFIIDIADVTNIKDGINYSNVEEAVHLLKLKW